MFSQIKGLLARFDNGFLTEGDLATLLFRITVINP